MPTDARVDAYIKAAAPFAQPILAHVRQLVHATLPEAQETMKWSMPFFELVGRPLAMMAAFKAHAGLGIFDGGPMAGATGMGQFGKITRVGDLPDDSVLVAKLQAAAALIADGAGPKMRSAPKAPKPELTMPDDLAGAFAAAPVALAHFNGFPPSAQREYLEWVLEAKRPETRAKRIADAVGWCGEGKRRYWAMAGR